MEIKNVPPFRKMFNVSTIGRNEEMFITEKNEKKKKNK